MTDPSWPAVEAWLDGALIPRDPALDRTLARNRDAGLPDIGVPASLGKLLHLLARSIAATRILEVGTLGGYSTIWLARALPPGGQLVTLELAARHAEVASANLAGAGLADRVELRVGRAADRLDELEREAPEPFDLVFIDADKASNATYFASAMRLTRPGSLIVVDNVVRGGAAADPASTDTNVVGVRRLIEAMAEEPRVEATAIQTVGSKGYDGFVVALVVAAPLAS